MKVFKFVITGGPCGGKTTALKRIKEKLSDSGINVLIVPETATELIGGNITIDTVGAINLQKLIFRLQQEKEEIFDIAAEKLNKDTVIIYDRGLLDGNAYISNREFDEILQLNNLSREQLLSRYDAVFHFVTSALGAEMYYTLDNNSARSEDINTAKTVDEKTADAWKSHPDFYYYDNSTDFETKINRCIKDMIKFISEH